MCGKLSYTQSDALHPDGSCALESYSAKSFLSRAFACPDHADPDSEKFLAIIRFSLCKKKLNRHHYHRRIDALNCVGQWLTARDQMSHVGPRGLREHHERLVSGHTPRRAPRQYGDPREPQSVAFRGELHIKEKTLLRDIFSTGMYSMLLMVVVRC